MSTFQSVGGGGFEVQTKGSAGSFQTAYTASADALVALVASGGTVRNVATGVDRSPDEVLTVRSGETIEYTSSDSQARVIQIGGN